MKERDFDKIFKEKLANYEGAKPDGAVWSSIERSLHKRAGLPYIFRKVLYGAAAVAAIFVIALIITDNNTSTINMPKEEIVADSAPAMEKSLDNANDDAVNESRTDSAEQEKKLPRESVAAVQRAVAEVVAEKENPTAENGAIENTGSTEKDQATPEKGESNKEKESDYRRDELLQNNYLLADNNNSYNSRKSYTLSLFSNVISNKNISVSGQYLQTMAASGLSGNSEMANQEIISDADYSLPINFGIQAQVKVKSFLSVGIGFSYAWLNSKYDALLNKRYYRIKQTLHYVGIPVNLYFNFVDTGNLRFYGNLGGNIEKGVKASYKLKSYDGFSKNTTAKIDGFQYSANAGLGMEYLFSNQFGLYLEPNLVYYFDSKIPASIRTDQPLQLKAEVGVRFHLGNQQ